MLPSQTKAIKTWVTMLSGHLSDIRDAVKDNETAIRDASTVASEKSAEIPRVIASAIISAANKDVTTYEKSQRCKEYRLQQRFLKPAWATAIATVLAFLAAAIYALSLIHI